MTTAGQRDEKPDVIRLGQRGRVLGTRKLGREFADLISERAARSGRPIVIDFDGVEVASSPVLDEIVCALLAAIVDYPDRVVTIANLNDYVRETLWLVLESREPEPHGRRRRGDRYLVGALRRITNTRTQEAA